MSDITRTYYGCMHSDFGMCLLCQKQHLEQQLARQAEALTRANETIEEQQQRLAAAEARADHVSFENEVDTQQLEAKLAAAEALLREAVDDYASHTAACVSTDRVRAKCDCGFAEWYQRAKDVIGGGDD